MAEHENGDGSLLTAREAGGTAVIDAALALPSVIRIEPDGWKELKANRESLDECYIEWTVPGSWDPFSQRLPEMVSLVVYYQEGQRFQKCGARSNVKILFGAATEEQMMGESLTGDADVRNVEEGLEMLHGVTRQERLDYWRTHPTLPRSAWRRR